MLALKVGQPSPALAALSEWKPVLIKYNSTLTLESAYTVNSNTNNVGLNETVTRQRFRESLQVGTLGYVYHPDLILFSMSGSRGQDQSFSPDDSSAESQQGGYDAYDLAATIFKRKPFTVEMFTNQSKPFSASATDALNNETVQESEAVFKYNDQAYRAKLICNTTERTDTDGSSVTDLYDFFGSLRKPKVGFMDNFTTSVITRYQVDEDTIALRDSTAGTSDNTASSTSQQGTISNSFNYKVLGFSTDLGAYTTQFNGEGSGGALSGGSEASSEMMNFNESVFAELPWDFTSRLFYSTLTNKFAATREKQLLDTSPGRSIWESTRSEDRLRFYLTQKLYDSLVTELTATLEDRQSERVDNEEPVHDESSGMSYALTSRYNKRLPLASSLTGGLTTSVMQTTRLGRDFNNKPYFDVEANNRWEIRLPSDTDVAEPIAVYVLMEKEIGGRQTDDCLPPEQIAGSVYKNDPLSASSCWALLVKNDEYRLNTNGSRPTIEILSRLSANPDNYVPENVNDPDNTIFYPSPVFWVTSMGKPANSTTQSNTSGLSMGLNLFSFMSTGYQHTVTSQELVEGVYNGSLPPEITDDSVTFGAYWDQVTFGASRQWIATTEMETVTRLKVSYDKNMTFFALLGVDFDADAYTGESETTRKGHGPLQSKEDGYSYGVNARLPIPYVDAQLQGRHRYAFDEGGIVHLALNEYGLYEYATTPDYEFNDRTSILNSLSLNKSVRVPWIEADFNSYVRYRWDTNTNGEETSDSKGLEYGLNTHRNWVYGATSITLSVNYAISDETFGDVGHSYGGTTSRIEREEFDDQTSVRLTVVRRLF